MAPRESSQTRWFPLVILVTGSLVYLNSFSAPFIFDGKPWIVENYRIRHLWPVWDVPIDTGRLLTDLSFALNYAAGGLHPAGYHAVNLAIHLLAGLLLYGLVRRSLQQPVCAARYGAAAPGLALATTLLWVVHPLQTQSVTYIVQRAEALMGLWYLATLYCVLRSTTAPQPSRWQTAAILNCALGMASKPIMVTAPLMVLLYDRVFLAGSFRRAWQQRRGLYLGLLASWGLLALLLAVTPTSYSTSAGFGYTEVRPVEYLATQPGVIWHYLRLAVWPHPLVLDYVWPVAKTARAILLPALGLLLLLGLAVWGLWRKSVLGFWGAWFFVILAPSSSFIPIADLAFEHRMYLPLAAPIVMVVLAVHQGLRQLFPDTARLRRRLGAGLAAVGVAVLGGLTLARNADYRTEETMWRDTLSKRPANARAYESLGSVLLDQRKFDEAIGLFQEAIRLKPSSWQAYYNLAMALGRRKECEEALTQWRQSLGLRAALWGCRSTIEDPAEQGALRQIAGRVSQQLSQDPGDLQARRHLAIAQFLLGQRQAAVEQFVVLLMTQQERGAPVGNLGRQLASIGMLDQVMGRLREHLGQ